jgi:hypothetical protein
MRRERYAAVRASSAASTLGVGFNEVVGRLRAAGQPVHLPFDSGDCHLVRITLPTFVEHSLDEAVAVPALQLQNVVAGARSFTTISVV